MGFTAPEAKTDLERLVRRDPRTLDVHRTRWRLRDLLTRCDGWAVHTPGGMSRLLARLGISYQRGREYVHSPDPDYAAKVADIAAVLRETRRSGPRGVAVYLDELTYYRHPTTAQAYAPRGQQPRAERSHHANTSTRVVATLGDLDGKVVRQQGTKVGVRELVRFYRTLRESYPQATRLYVILDNWPIHFHPDVLVALEPQEQRWKPKLSPSCPTGPTAAAGRRW